MGIVVQKGLVGCKFWIIQHLLVETNPFYVLLIYLILWVLLCLDAFILALFTAVKRTLLPSARSGSRIVALPIKLLYWRMICSQTTVS